MPHTPAVIVAKTFRRPSLRERRNYIQHAFQSGVIRTRNVDAVARGQQARMEKEVECVDVIVERLLEVHAVRTHLPLRLMQHDSPSGLLPGRGPRHLWIQSSDKKQRHRLPDQVRVWRKISR